MLASIDLAKKMCLSHPHRRGDRMPTVSVTRGAFLILLGGVVVAWPCAVIAQTPTKVYRIDLLSGAALVTDALTVLNRKRVVEFAAAHRLPAIYEFDSLVRAGGLRSYGPDLDE